MRPLLPVPATDAQSRRRCRTGVSVAGLNVWHCMPLFHELAPDGRSQLTG